MGYWSFPVAMVTADQFTPVVLGGIPHVCLTYSVYIYSAALTEVWGSAGSMELGGGGGGGGKGHAGDSTTSQKNHKSLRRRRSFEFH